jgi:hypothetical protein
MLSPAPKVSIVGCEELPSMQSYERKADGIMTWIDTADADANAISRADYEQLAALIDPENKRGREVFVITKPLLERLLRSIAVALTHAGQ